MNTPPPSNHCANRDCIRSWSESLKSQTRDAIEECRVNPATQKLHLKNIDGNYGYITLQDLLADQLHVHCEKSGECWTGDCVDDLLAAGWAID